MSEVDTILERCKSLTTPELTDLVMRLVTYLKATRRKDLPDSTERVN